MGQTKVSHAFYCCCSAHYLYLRSTFRNHSTPRGVEEKLQIKKKTLCNKLGVGMGWEWGENGVTIRPDVLNTISGDKINSVMASSTSVLVCSSLFNIQS